MGIIGKFLSSTSAAPDNRPLLQRLVDYVKNNSMDKAVSLLVSTGKKGNPVSIPYTPEAVSNDFTAIQLCMRENSLTDNELASLVATKLLKKHPKGIKNFLAENGYDMPGMDRITYLNTYTSSILSLREFVSIGVKNYRVSGCGDERMCAKCAKQNGKKHMISKAVIGKTAPPFCEKCRCIIIADF